MKPISKSNIPKKYTEVISNEDKNEDFNSYQKVVLMPINYPLNNKQINLSHIEEDNINKFAHEQWEGLQIYTGQYLLLFDDEYKYSLYHVIFIEFEGIIINKNTIFYLSNKNTNNDILDLDIINYISHSINFEKRKLNIAKKITIKIIGYVNSNSYLDEDESNIEDLTLFKEYIREQ